MREYENNSSTNNENSENDTALSIETLIINLHTSFHLENFRLIHLDAEMKDGRRSWRLVAIR